MNGVCTLFNHLCSRSWSPLLLVILIYCYHATHWKYFYFLTSTYACSQEQLLTSIVSACFFFPVGCAVNHFHIYNVKKALWAIILVVNKLLLLLKCHGSLLNYWISLPVKTINLVSTTFLWASQPGMFYVRHIQLEVLLFLHSSGSSVVGISELDKQSHPAEVSSEWFAISWVFRRWAGIFKQLQRCWMQQ